MTPHPAPGLTGRRPDRMSQAGFVDRARRLAHRLLAAHRAERWHHTQGVADQAARIAVAVDAADRPLLIAGAWLHDIGYSPALENTGFHPLDGALYLAGQGWNGRLVALVAHHSGARFVPAERGLTALLNRFPFEDGPVADALTYADQTIGPHGHRMTMPDRIAEAITRHGPHSPDAGMRIDRIPYLRAVADRVENRLTTAALPISAAPRGHA
jgi:hypothetical protein